MEKEGLDIALCDKVCQWLEAIGPYAGVIYSLLFKYTQYTTCFTENSIGPEHPETGPVSEYSVL
jgi:hypothetical protein